MIKLNIMMQIDSVTTNIGINKVKLFESIWFWIILVIVLSITLVLRKHFNDKKKLAFGNVESNDKKKAQASAINMEDLMNNINGASELYKELSRTYHPDKFIGTNLEIKANKIFQEISANKRNYDGLCKIKERAQKELN
jgi:membrane-associated HD superfamily phosphohydrolase